MRELYVVLYSAQRGVSYVLQSKLFKGGYIGEYYGATNGNTRSLDPKPSTLWLITG